MGCSNSTTTTSYIMAMSRFYAYDEICLEEHNLKRDLHDSPHLLKNEQLCNLAEKCALELSKNENNINYIYKDEFLGQNIYIYKGNNLNIRNIFNEWYEEIKYYNSNLNKFQKNSSHFTQMIWKETKEIGFGYIERGDTFYAVALYYPPGNTFGEFKNNVIIK